MTLVEGPDWSGEGLDLAAGRYPLSVEAHVGRLVDALLPGVITTTTCARQYGVHGLAFLEADQRGLDDADTYALLRRMEVVISAVSLLHRESGACVRALPAAHGADRVAAWLERDGELRLEKVSAPYTGYVDSRTGFAGVYQNSEALLGILKDERPPKPGTELDGAALRSAIGDAVALADRAVVSIDELRAAAHLCVCVCADAADGAWLRGRLVSEDVNGSARRDTITLIARLVAADDVTGSLQERFRYAMAFGSLVASDALAAGLPIHGAWQALALRNYSVSAWRRLWSWLVDHLDEPKTATALGEALANELPDIAVGDLLAGVGATVTADGSLRPIEAELRAQALEPVPTVELQTLAIGAGRLRELSPDVLPLFAGRSDEDDLGPLFVAELLGREARTPLRRFGRELVQFLLDRSQRVALSRADRRNDGSIFLRSRVHDRDGIWWREGYEGHGDVALRIDTLGEILVGSGILARRNGRWALADEGAAVLA